MERRVRRTARSIRWYGKGLSGASRNILVELGWRLGDEIMAIPIYEALNQRYRNDRVSVLCSFPELLEGNPYIHQAVGYQSATPQNIHPVDRYICLRNGPRRIRRLAHYARLADVPTPRSRPQLHFADWHTPHLDALPPGGGPLVALAAGASWPTKRWSTERWQMLAETLQNEGCRLAELGGDVTERIGVGTDLVGKTTVRDAACILRAVDLLISCDSGLMHLALAAGTPVAALFGPTDPRILIDEDEPGLIPIKSNRECQGCWNRLEEEPSTPGVCPLGQENCLEPVTVEQVLESVRPIPAGFVKERE